MFVKSVGNSSESSSDLGQILTYPDAGQTLTLARRAAPLAACVQRHSCTTTLTDADAI